MLNPVPLLTSLRFQPRGGSEVAGRPTIRAHSISRLQDSRHGPAFSSSSAPVPTYELEVDRQLGVLLAVPAIRDKQPFHRITTLAAAFDQPIPDETFRFDRRPVNRSNRGGVRSVSSTSRSLRRNNGPRSRC